jgi:hypothetical protein
MRSMIVATTILVLAGAGGGCEPRRGSGPHVPYALVIDAAEIAATGPGGQPWCANGALMTSVVARLGATSAATASAGGLMPEWRQGLLEAFASDYAAGVELKVEGNCGEGSFAMGSLTIRPRASRMHDGAVVVVAFGSSVRLRVHFRMSRGPGSGGGSAWIDDGGWSDCVDLDCGWVDDTSWVDEGDWSDDSGWSDEGGWHDEGDAYDDDGGDGSYDEGGGSDDGGYDDGDGVDGGGSDDGSSDGGDDAGLERGLFVR